ncbi:unnamed protein product, partial [Effrenium voratum]
ECGRCRRPPAMFQQESVVAAVKNLFPAVSFRGVQFPTLVDVLNTETSLGFCLWAHGPGVLQILDMKPCRLVGLLPGSSPRIAAASDAAQDGPESGSGGFLISTPSLERVGAVVHIDLSVFALWRTATTKIAQLELLMVLQALLTFLDAFRGATGVFYVDNIAALLSLVRGRSDNHELDYLSIDVMAPNRKNMIQDLDLKPLICHVQKPDTCTLPAQDGKYRHRAALLWAMRQELRAAAGGNEHRSRGALVPDFQAARRRLKVALLRRLNLEELAESALDASLGLWARVDWLRRGERPKLEKYWAQNLEKVLVGRSALESGKVLQ